MKLLLTIPALFATSALAAKYAAGQDCRTNKGCDQNCLGSKWSVIMEAGSVRMVCDPTTLDSTRYVRATCLGQDQTKEKTVCDAVKGKHCDGVCYVTTPASKEEDLTQTYENTCHEQKNGDGSQYDTLVNLYPSKAEALGESNCKSVF